MVKGFAFPSPKSGILTPAEADKLAPTGGAAKVRVLSVGSEPLAVMKYTPTKGATQGLKVDFGVKMGITTAGQEIPKIVVPPQTEDVDVVTEEVDDGSGALVAMLLRRVHLLPTEGIDQETADAMSGQLAGMNGYAFRERVGPHGEASESKTELPASFPKGAEQLAANMNGAFQAMIPRLPSEAVGVGAKWQVLSREAPAGTSLVQLTDYTLKSRSGSQATLDYVARQLAASESIKLPTGVPAGVTTKLAKFTLTITGSVTIDLKEMAPLKGRTAHVSKLKINIVAPGNTQMQADVDMKMSVVLARRNGATASAAPSASSSASAAPSSAPTTTPSAPPAIP